MSSFANDKRDSPSARLKAAKRYFQVTQTKKTLDDMIFEMTNHIPPEKRDEFIIYMNAGIDLGAALLRRPLLTGSGSLYCFILDKFTYLITFR